MASSGSEINDPNGVVYSLPTIEEPPSTGTLPTLPFVLVEEILCRLPVKLLLQLRSLCKSWKSLISDHKFAKKHLQMSKICQQQHHLLLNNSRQAQQLFWHSPIPSVFNNIPNSTVTLTQLNCPIYDDDLRISSCDGILCLTIDNHSAILWNPSIRRYNRLPRIKPQWGKTKLSSGKVSSLYSFGYDHANDVYKVVAISFLNDSISVVNVHTMGTDYWRRIEDFPHSPIRYNTGVFVSGTVNWLALDLSAVVIVSLNLKNESYQNLLQPNFEEGYLKLGVLRDCLCIFGDKDMFLNVWIMKEFGNKESWTKLFSVPHVGISNVVHSCISVVYISEDDQVLINGGCEGINFKLKLFVYNSKSGTLKIPKIGNMNRMVPYVYIESLISPRS